MSSMTRQCVRGRRIGETTKCAASTDVNGTQRCDSQMKVDDARCKPMSV